MKRQNPFTAHALCQALKLEGVSDRTEANIESFLRKLWEANGPDFVISYLKVIKKDTEKSLVEPNYRYEHENGSPSVAWDHRNNRPKGPLGSIYRKFPKPIERVRVLGAIINSIVYEYHSDSQAEKFIKNIRHNFRTSAHHVPELPVWTLQRLERALEKHIREVQAPFGMQDLTNNVLPYDHVSVATARNKQIVLDGLKDRSKNDLTDHRSTTAVHRAVGELYGDMLGQFYTAPRCCKTFWNKILKAAYGSNSLIPQGVKYPSKITPRPGMARDYDFQPKYGRLADDCAEYSARGKADYVGRLDFLQKPGGKLRSVANVNRFVNYTMAPFAKAMEDVFYNTPCCCVKDQKSGLRWVQRQLVDNERLSSLDLSAATDTLDYRVLTENFKRSFPGKTGLLQLYAEYFETLSSLPLYCEPLGSAVQFRTGQPLGMKGSFQMLTAMNIVAGIEAITMQEYENSYRKHVPKNQRSFDNFGMEEGNQPGNQSKIRSRIRNDNWNYYFRNPDIIDPEFMVCGDDFVCKSCFAQKYSEVISSWGGSTNVEKAMESSQYAEFLSHIVSKDNVYITKPKYKPSTKFCFTNLEKAKYRDFRGIFKLNSDEKNAIDILSQYSVDEMDLQSTLPHLRSKQLQMDVDSLELMAVALNVVAELKSEKPKDFKISSNAMEYIFLENPSLLDDRKDKHFPTVIDQDNKKSKPSYSPFHEGIATVPTSTFVYNHRKGEAEEKQTSSQNYRAVLNKSQDMRFIHESYKDNKSAGKTGGVINLGFGREVHSDDLVSASLVGIEKANEPKPANRKETMTDESNFGASHQRRLMLKALDEFVDNLEKSSDIGRESLDFPLSK